MMNVDSIVSRAVAPSPAGSSSSGTAASSSTSGLANEQVFLQLLVAQLQKQDPTQPTDPMQFVSELAEFSSLEQKVQMRQDLDKIRTLTRHAVKRPQAHITPTPPTTLGSIHVYFIDHRVIGFQRNLNGD